MKHLLYILFAFPLLLCCCQTSNEHNGNGDANDTDGGYISADATVTDSDRIAILSQQMQNMIAQYDDDPNPDLLKRALDINDSISKIDTTEQGRFANLLFRSQILAKAGQMKEAIQIQEQLLSKDPNDIARLQFYASKYWMEGKQDSMRIFADKAIQNCDKLIADTTQEANVIDEALINKLGIYQLVGDRTKAKEVNSKLASRHPNDPNYQMTDEEFNAEFDAAREEFNRNASTYRNENK